MTTRYCAAAGCGKPNPYTAVKPKFCSSCGAPFDAAFSTAAHLPFAPSVTTPPPSSVVHYPTIPPPRVYRNAKAEDISLLYQERPTNQRGQAVTDSDDFYDREAAADEAQRLANTIRGSIRIGADIDEESKPVRLGSLANIQKAVADAGK